MSSNKNLFPAVRRTPLAALAALIAAGLSSHAVAQDATPAAPVLVSPAAPSPTR